MASPAAPAPNKQRVENGPEHVWRGKGGLGLEDFAAASGRAKAGRGSIGARLNCPARLAGVPSCALAATTQNQALSTDQLGHVARRPSHGEAKGTDFCGLAGGGRRIASYRTAAGSIDLVPAWPRSSGSARGGCFPLSRAVSPPYPGRAGQTTDLQKPAQGPACIADCIGHDPAVQGRKVSIVPTGSGVRGAPTRQGSARETGRGGESGSGVDAGLRHEFRLDRGKSPTLGGGRG